jgi:LysM repeat protein
MAARPSALLLVVLALATPARADPASPVVEAAARGAGEAAHALSKLRALLLLRLPGTPLKVPGSPRYLALKDPAARGTRLFVGWVLPGLSATELPDLLALTDALSAALRNAPATGAAPFDAAVALDMDGEAPLVVVELSTSRPSAGRALEEALFEAVARLGAAPSPAVAAGRDAPPASASSRVAAAARAQLGLLSRAVVEVHPPGAPAVVRNAKPIRHVVERGDTLSEIARAHGLDVRRLADLNELDPKRPIRPGDELKLSDKRPPLPKLYVVQKGDSLAKVARRFGVSEKALLEVNRLDDRRLSKGQKLLLPR